MEFQLLAIVTVLSVVMVASNADSSAFSPAAYWKAALPNTPMPKAIKVLTSQGALSNTTVGKLLPFDINITIGPFKYLYPVAADQLYDNQRVTVFFLENNLKISKNMTLDFTKSQGMSALLPRLAAQKIPFSSERFQEISNYFSVKPDSLEAKIMKESITSCEEPGIKGEVKYCATSLESMIDFATSKLGKNVNVVSTDVDRQTQLQEYTIIGFKKMPADEAVVCHKLNYVYAVFYCHKTSSPTWAYKVSMVGANGTGAEVIAVCHADTSAWNPKHMAFQVLNVKPGSVPICHFLPEGHVVWVPK